MSDQLYVDRVSRAAKVLKDAIGVPPRDWGMAIIRTKSGMPFARTIRPSCHRFQDAIRELQTEFIFSICQKEVVIEADETLSMIPSHVNKAACEYEEEEEAVATANRK
jgi:hypothetical protein